MHLGLLDDNSPRARELVWIMLAQRAARALSGLNLHGDIFDMEEAVEHAMTWTPRGWLTEGDLVRGEQSLYLRQPGYGTSYVTGKIQIEELLSEYAIQEGDDFTVKSFFDAFYGAGVIPIVLTRWEMIGGEGCDSGDELRIPAHGKGRRAPTLSGLVSPFAVPAGFGAEAGQEKVCYPVSIPRRPASGIQDSPEAEALWFTSSTSSMAGIAFLAMPSRPLT